MSSHIIGAEDISEADYDDMSQASNQSQFQFEENSDPQFENDKDYLPESEDESSQEFSQVDNVTRRVCLCISVSLQFCGTFGKLSCFWRKLDFREPFG